MFKHQSTTNVSKLIVTTIILIILFYIEAFKSVGFDVDSEQYYFLITSGNGWLDDSIEPVFNFLIWLSHFIFNANSYRFVIVCTILLSLLLKFKAIKSITNDYLIVLYAYTAFFYFLHDVVQIRVGLAIAFFLYALQDLRNKDIKRYFFKITLACFSHYSAIIFLPLYFISENKNTLKYYFFILVFAVSLAFVKIDITSSLLKISTFLPSILSIKIERYIASMQIGLHSDIVIFNFYNLVLLAFCFLLLMISKRNYNNFDIVLLKIFITSQAVYYIFSFLPIIAIRVSEMLGTVVIFLILIPVRTFVPNSISRFLVYIALTYILFFNSFIKNYVDWSMW